MQPTPQTGAQIPGADKKILAGILGIVLGGLGVHKFILGYNQEGAIMAGLRHREISGWSFGGLRFDRARLPRSRSC